MRSRVFLAVMVTTLMQSKLTLRHSSKATRRGSNCLEMNGLTIRLRLALYDHPKAGLCWEHRAKKVVLQNGFHPVRRWESLFCHPKEKLFLDIYVDDFKMSG